MDLLKDVLDNQLEDRNGVKMGRVDALVIVLPDDGPPRVSYLESGPAPMLRRVNRRLGDWVAARLGRLDDARGQLCRIPWSAVQHVGINVVVDRVAEATPAWAWEAWLRDHIVRYIPGSS